LLNIKQSAFEYIIAMNVLSKRYTTCIFQVDYKFIYVYFELFKYLVTCKAKKQQKRI